MRGDLPERAPAEAARLELAGYAVEAVDGRVGRVDDATDRVGGGAIVVDTGPWIFGKTVVLPHEVIERVDDDTQLVHVTLTREEVRRAPSYGL